MRTCCSKTRHTRPDLDALKQRAPFPYSASAEKNIRFLAMRDQARAMLCKGYCLWLQNKITQYAHENWLSIEQVKGVNWPTTICSNKG